MNLPRLPLLPWSLGRANSAAALDCPGQILGQFPRGRSRQPRLMISLATVVALSSGLWAESVPAQTGLPPIPPDTTYAVSPPASGQQYLVYVNGNSPLLLDQIRLVEPEAFLTTIEGRSVIQVGRFNDWNNAQNLVNDLSGLGVGAQIQTAAAVIAPAAPVYPAATGSVAVTATDLPPLPVTAAPPVVDFGQAPTPPGSTSPTALPTAPPTRSTGSRSGYYVVIPAAQRDLPSLAQQVTRLGAPANLVQMRQAPRGTHVAVGPFDDRGIAEDWSRYLAETGLDTRVHYE